MMLVPTTLREVAVNNILIVGVDMSPYNEFRLRRLVYGLRAAEFVVKCRENAECAYKEPWRLAHAKAVAQYREYKLNSFLKHHGVKL